jgi:predicted alpha/beta superfamily hydrolase
MKKIILFVLILSSVNSYSQQSVPSSGRLIHFEKFNSAYIQQRNVDVWLPGNYDSTKKYAVLYMHDGQMLFDSTVTWNKQEWQADETISDLLNKKKIRDCIIVAVWNTGSTRHSEYFPEKPIRYIAPGRLKDSLINNDLKGKPQSDNYLLFLTKELKPFIDKKFPTKKDRANTFIAGSSMGGLISLYAICEYPLIFGGAACLSTHWLGNFNTENNPIPDVFIKYFSTHLPSPKNHRIYFDYGTATLDQYYKPYQQKMDEVMKLNGYSRSNWITNEFVGEDHSERAWGKRLSVPVLFLLKKNN